MASATDSGSPMLAMFPGQGSQYVGMGKTLFGEFPMVRLLFEEAEDACKLQLRRLCCDGPEDDLKLTANTQPCLLTLSYAIWRVLVSEAALAPALFAGHSLGEFSAVVAAGKLPFARAVYLVRRRGEAMQAAVAAGIGAMAAVMNVPAQDLQDRCKRLSRADSVVEVVNFNSPQQLVVAGHKTAVDRLRAELSAEKLKAVDLPVSAPFHSSLMAPARTAMAPLLADSPFTATPSRIIANLTARVEPDYGPRFLTEQINSPVLWTQTLETAVQQGCGTFLEIGPGKVLTGLARRTVHKEARLLNTEDLKQTLKDLSARVA